MQGKGYEVISSEIRKWSYWYADYITVCYKSKYITFANAKQIYRFDDACFSELNIDEAENKIKKYYEEVKRKKLIICINKNRYIYQYKILINSKNANFGIEIANKSSGFLLYDLDNSDIDYISLYNIDLFIDIINNKIATS